MKTPLLKSRRFWMAVMDAGLAVISVVVSLQFNEAVQKLVMTIFMALQPVFIAIIIAFTVDDIIVAQARAQAKAKAQDCCN